MLSLGKFPPNAIYRPRLFVLQSQFPIPIRLVGLNVGKLRNGLCCTALKSNNKGGFSAVEMDGPDEFEEEEEEEEEVIIPLQNMKKWLENRPRGFGEGKVYDTSIEDKLTEEIEQSRKAQLANVNKLKDNTTTAKPGTKKETDKQAKGSTKVENGIRVRLTNLPKKKNIHRDLRLAFNGVLGILDITPVVSGNEKTRDPVCKGLAFVDFKHPDQAHRFVQDFSGTSVSFGRVEKRITCELANPNLPRPASDDKLTEAEKAILSVQLDEDDDGGSNDSDLIEQELEKPDESQKNDKKAVAKRRKDKVPKLRTITGSAKRLKTRDKSVLTGVLTKYGPNGGVKSR